MSPTLNPSGATAVTGAHLSSTTWTLLSGVLPSFVTS